MAKVMISVPDELLEQADALASSLGTTRSGYIQRLMAGDIDASNQASRDAMRRIIGMAGPHGAGGNAAELVKQSRPKY